MVGLRRPPPSGVPCVERHEFGESPSSKPLMLCFNFHTFLESLQEEHHHLNPTAPKRWSISGTCAYCLFFGLLACVFRATGGERTPLGEFLFHKQQAASGVYASVSAGETPENLAEIRSSKPLWVQFLGLGFILLLLDGMNLSVFPARVVHRYFFDRDRPPAPRLSIRDHRQHHHHHHHYHYQP